MRIRGNGNLTNMTNFMPSLNTTGSGYVEFDTNGKLETMLNVFSTLTTCENLRITSNNALTSFGSASGFGKLEKINERWSTFGFFFFSNNNELLAIDGAFPAMVYASSFKINENAKLQSTNRASLPVLVPLPACSAWMACSLSSEISSYEYKSVLSTIITSRSP